MSTNIALTTNFDGGGKFGTATISGSGSTVILDTAGDVTSSFYTNGYKSVEFQYELATVGTSVVVAIEVQTSASGQWVERTVSTAQTANGTYALTFSGYSYNTRLKLKTITTGTPAIRNITGTCSDRYV